ncbi:MAG: exonuclease SbcCD subunit D [Fimbriimonadaceae bacterium]|nr:exonuclease SbcCD subunit D [Fimbriimonadaceae bacterium]
MRLLHFADTHLGVETYGRVDPATGRHSRLQDFAATLNQALDVALSEPLDAALFAGDAYRTCYPSPTHQQIFAEAIGRLLRADVPLVLVAGNHDLPVAFGRNSALDVFGSLAAERVTVLRQPGLVSIATAAGTLQVVGLPWPTPALLRGHDATLQLDDQALLARLRQLCEERLDQLAQQLEPALPAVLLAHVTAADAVFSGSEKVGLVSGDPALSRGVLADPRFDYVALGHVHRHQELNGGQRPAVVYCGSLDRIDFGEANDVKGVCLVSIAPGPTPAARTVTWRHAPLAVRPFVALELAVPPHREATAYLVERLRDLELRDAVLRVRYTCTDEQYAKLDSSAVRRAVDGAFLVAGLIRERPAVASRPRVEVTEHHGLPEALGRYLDTRPELVPLRNELMQAGLALEQELQASSPAAGSLSEGAPA